MTSDDQKSIFAQPYFEERVVDGKIEIPHRHVEEFSPRAIHTRGKVISAAGLTAALIKDEESYEFVIEISREAEEFIVQQYKLLRQHDGCGVVKSAWCITVRQLDSLIRLSEAMARMYGMYVLSKEEHILIELTKSGLKMLKAGAEDDVTEEDDPFMVVNPNYVLED
ncbi:hypothetical protein chiPu_0000954 [Chiloscyllium punctatum]|uniref:MCM C-terminal AAA(+) ATPase domain-containing protein n=1 Tax=Chiloscyllium punctatum TaxID=137246 RepID=A0A401RWP1_CHIPU|nr:hypothetical protein [Chiloscyllium punctatum]